MEAEEDDDNIVNLYQSYGDPTTSSTPTQYMFEVDEEDVMEGTALPFEQRAHFIRLNVAPPDTTITGSQDYAMTREQQNIQVSSGDKAAFVYVESATTGKFRRVRLGRFGYKPGAMGGSSAGADDDTVNKRPEGRRSRPILPPIPSQPPCTALPRVC